MVSPRGRSPGRARRTTTALDPRWKKATSALALVLFGLVLARTIFLASRRPVLNFDMLPAMALAVEWEVDDPVEVHRRTYEAARTELPAPAFRDLTAPGVRQARLEDPGAFHEHLAFYRARILYTLAIYSLWKLGAPLTAATWWVSLGSYALLSTLLLVWLGRRLPLALAVLFALGLAHTPALLMQASYSTADSLSTLLLCLGAFTLVERGSFRGGALWLTLSILARPDAVILIFFLALATRSVLERSRRPPLPWCLGWLALSAATYLALQRFAGEYGWWPLFTISFDEKAVHPARLPTAIDWGRYGEILARQIGSIPGNGYFPQHFQNAKYVTGSTLVFAYAAFALGGLALWRRARAELAPEAALLAALLATYLLRFFLFPQLWDRFFAPFYVLVPLCLVSLVAKSLERAPVVNPSPRAP